MKKFGHALGIAVLAGLAVGGSASALESWNGRIFQVGSTAGAETEIGWLRLIEELRMERQIVLGEKHQTPAVQSAQAALIDAVVRAADSEGSFHVAWEFLDYSDRARIQTLYSSFAQGSSDAEGLLKGIFHGADYSSYAPILNVVKHLRGSLVAVNLSRAEKAPIVQGGLGAAGPGVIPPGFELGGAAYLQRFKEAMGDHAPPEKIANYFAAHCLTDDVMAWHFTRLPFSGPRFLIAGSFHADYRDGAVRRILRRDSSQGLAAVRFFDASDFTRAELETGLSDLLRDSFGAVADFVIFVNEPRAPLTE